MKIAILAAAAMGVAATTAFAQDAAWPEDARVYIISPADGETVASPFKVQFGLSGLGVAPAGVDHPNTGHHHILINRAAPSGEDLQFGLPAEDDLVHFGGGQTEGMLDLPPGEHTLQMIMGDAGHVPLDPPLVSKVITVTVSE